MSGNNCNRCGEHIIDCWCKGERNFDSLNLREFLEYTRKRPVVLVGLNVLIERMVKEIERQEKTIQNLEARIANLEILQ